ncbi:hypothetical protein EIP86_000827 [Pleurotus ostreatoroseus]|nr:hypothetical protein EIP86_000827 [Pleurotus ostreatoroseus]
MCGILFQLRSQAGAYPDHGPENEFDATFEHLKAFNAARGPDAQDTVTTHAGTLELTYFGSELRLRGHGRISQPHRDTDGNLLCWNGEVFEGLDISDDENDGAKLFGLLRNTQNTEDILDIFGHIEGPYAFVFYHHKLQKLFFARDPLGRRSLLIHTPSADSPRFLLASVSVGASSIYSVEELPTQHIYCLDIDRLAQLPDLVSGLPHCLASLPRQGADGTRPFRQATGVYDTQGEVSIVGHYDLIDRVTILSRDNVGKAHVAVLFSGGIDSTMLAYLAHRHIPANEPIDLLNVSFENPRKILVKADGNIGGLPKRERKQKLREPTDYATIEVDYNVPDRVTGLQELEELRRLCPGRTWNFEYQNAKPMVESLMFPGRTVMDLSLAMALYFAARGVGQVRANKEAEAVPYTTPARVLLNGLGSDELLGGYGRFRTAFKHGGWAAIIDERKKLGIDPSIPVPVAIGAALFQASIYDVPGGYRAVMFDRFAGVKDKAKPEGTHFLVPWLQRAILYDCRIKPRNISTTTGSKDLQMVSITLRVLSRPDVEHLPKIYQGLGLDYDERVLPSIGNEVLKSIVAQFDAAELITQREVVSSRIREDLLQRAGEFNLKLEDVSITHLTFGKVSIPHVDLFSKLMYACPQEFTQV